jgi:hypothetical protein
MDWYKKSYPANFQKEEESHWYAFLYRKAII